MISRSYIIERNAGVIFLKARIRWSGEVQREKFFSIVYFDGTMKIRNIANSSDSTGTRSNDNEK